MHRRSVRSLAGGIILPLALLGGAGPALAHGRGGMPPAPIQGIVTDWSGSVLQVQPQNGANAVNVTVTGATHITRLVAGSLADIRPRQQVHAHLRGGTTTIDSIEIDAAVQKNAFHPNAPDRGDRGHTTLRKTGIQQTKPMNRVDGQVVSINRSAGTITLQVMKNKIVKYALAQSLNVTKELNGTSADLGIDEMVRVLLWRNGTAADIEIMQA